jgi:biotin transporter BioY
MAKLDQVKERLNNYRLAVTLLVGVESLLLAGLVSSYRSGIFDLYYWLGADFAILLLFVIALVVRSLLKITDHIGDLS